jgi:rubrerythrin
MLFFFRIMASPTHQTRSKGQERSPGGQFRKWCCCLNHANYSEGEHFTWLKTANCKGRLSLNRLIEIGLIDTLQSKRLPTWICTACLRYSETNFVDERRRPGKRNAPDQDEGLILNDEQSENEQDGDVAMVAGGAQDAPMADMADDDQGNVNILPTLTLILLNFIGIKQKKNGWDDFSNDEKDILIDIARLIGDLVQMDLYRDSKNNIQNYKTAINLDSKDWLQTCNPLVISFLKGCTKVNNASADKKVNALAHCVEQVLCARNLNVVTPLAFRRNVVQYSISGSKMSTQLMGAWEPSGGYTTVRNYIDAPCDPPPCPDGDVQNAIDNEQRVAKSSGSIKEASKVKVDICTTLSHIQPQSGTNVQTQEDLKPEKWQNRSNQEVRKDIVEQINIVELAAVDKFRSYRSVFLSEVLNRVIKEQESNQTGHLQDYVDISLHQRANGSTNYVCSNCKFVYHDGQCPSCNFNPDIYPRSYDVYARTESKHPRIPPIVSVGEPCIVNPNTEANVGKALKHVQHYCGVGKDRKWTVVWSDAIPYLFGSRLQDNLYTCDLCQVEIDVRKNPLEQHIADCPSISNRPTFSKVFGDLLMRPGPGHIEMNMARCALKFCWEPLFCQIAKMLGFRTQKAQDVVKNGIDHHRSMQIVRIVLQALSLELVVPYVRIHPEDPTPAGYMSWVNQHVVDPTYLLLWHLCFAFLLSLQLYNEVTRKNNSDNMLAARVVFAPLFFGRRHRLYQELHLRDMVERVQYPPPLLQHAITHESFSVSGRTNCGQGADFIHEEVNRLVKSFLPPAGVSSETWQRVCRKADALQAMKKACMKTSGLGNESSLKPPKRLENEVTMVRRELRSHEMTTEPLGKRPMMSLSGEVLDTELPNFRDSLEENYNAYKNNFIQTGNFGGMKLKPIHVTRFEREKSEKIENKTKDEIRREMEGLLQQFSEQTTIDFYNMELQNLKPTDLKVKYIGLHTEMKRSLEEELAAEFITTGDVEEQ